MAGNTINVQGNYIDVHDNEVVNLNIDKASVQVQDNEKAGNQDDELNERALVLTEKAVERGFCKQEGWQYKWGVKVEAAYFSSLANERFNL